MFKRQKNLEIKIFDSGATLIAGGYFGFLRELIFGVWDFSVSSLSVCRTTRPTAL
jgi:hypothetical protein